jgi:hypothetical protein
VTLHNASLGVVYILSVTENKFFNLFSGYELKTGSLSHRLRVALLVELDIKQCMLQCS